jgi:hypothetical protein
MTEQLSIDCRQNTPGCGPTQKLRTAKAVIFSEAGRWGAGVLEMENPFLCCGNSQVS